MTGDLTLYKYTGTALYDINSYTAIDAETIGVHVGQDFVGTLLTPPSLKGDITNVSRTEHGTRFKTLPYYAEKSLTLNVVIVGASRSQQEANLTALMAILGKGHFAVKVRVSSQVFFLNYQSSQSYSLTRSGRSAKMAIKCNEYAPTQRAFTGTDSEVVGPSLPTDETAEATEEE